MQKWNIILGILWLACYNPEIDWRTGEVKIMRCPEECGKQWKPKQEKLEWQKQKEEEKKKEVEKKQEESGQKKEKENPKKKRKVEVRKVVEEWENWNEEEEVAKSSRDKKIGTGKVL